MDRQSSVCANCDILPWGPSLSPPNLSECYCTVMANILCPASWFITWPSEYTRRSGPAQSRTGRRGWAVEGIDPSLREEYCRQLGAYSVCFTLHSGYLDLRELQVL